MLDKDYKRRISELKEYLSSILKSDAIPIYEIIKNKPHQFDVRGIYTITTPDDNTIVWVGQTRTKTVAGRIRDHCKLNQSSDLNVMLRNYPSYPQDYDAYLVRCFEEVDERERSQLEHFLIGVLQPVFNK